MEVTQQFKSWTMRLIISDVTDVLHTPSLVVMGKILDASLFIDYSSLDSTEDYGRQRSSRGHDEAQR
ncbi:hypothetical protein IEQ34_016500 [Dendrobium chrysotoxum]|uniref:Uncharacterized protein n=1 Tax=Dendrobium chrysotoxum TaxID=161865 RepID=A0AAV7GDL7_DENCH|nr:hypothetical protein IEQ34_016500 [Dendrobium chrysotoxum]